MLTRYTLEVAARDRGVPEHLIDGLAAYALEGRRTGSYLEAVLSEDWEDADARADATSREGAAQTYAFICDLFPPESCGSREKVAAWLKKWEAERVAEVRP